jgi:hypothetical protein
MNMVKLEDTTSTLHRENSLQLVRKIEERVLLVKMAFKPPNAPAVVTRRLSAGPESTAISVAVFPSVDFRKMFPNLLATLKALTRLICDETAMIERTNRIIIVLHLPNMLQPFVLSNKCANIRRARVIWAFPFPFNRMFCRSVSVKIMVVLERFSVGTARLIAQERIRMNVRQMLLQL